jgi:23S rRNA (cytosine1962-C5)-methyltransferase
MPADPLRARLKSGRDKSVRNGHPWIFSGAIEGWNREPQPGEAVEVHGPDNTWLARGFASPDHALSIRIYTWRQDEALAEPLFMGRLDEAVVLRERFVLSPETNACRLVFSESDALSGLIVDRYADVLAVQVGARGLVPYLPAMIDHLRQRTGLHRIVVTAEKDVVAREGLDPAALAALGTDSAAAVEILENGLRFDVNVGGGHKTGYYLDQRDNRAAVARYAAGRSMLSCYCYTGAFEVYAARAGAREIIGVDSSGPALALARRHHERNGSTCPIDYQEGDVADMLRRFRDKGSSFDLIVLDPPRFVQTTAQKEKGLRAYKDINLLALKLLAKEGILATFSCSGLVSTDDLKTVLSWAAKDAGRPLRIIGTLGQPVDHPVSAAFPEGEYLGGLLGYAR